MCGFALPVRIVTKFLFNDTIPFSIFSFVEFKINSLGFTVYLDNDPQETFEEKYIIPIRYDSLYGCYIPDDEFREKMEENDVGITYEEVCLIKEIMKIMIAGLGLIGGSMAKA